MECNIGKDSMDHIHVNVLEGVYFVKLVFKLPVGCLDNDSMKIWCVQKEHPED